MSRVLVISPHPDDETIGCGGALRKHVTDGDDVHAVFLTSGERGGHGRAMEVTRALRQNEARKAAQILGLAQIEFWDLPDGAIRATADAIQKLKRTIKRLRPDRIYVTHPGEMHPDHRAAARLVRRATANGSPRSLPLILGYEVWTPLQHMDVIIDITPFIQIKLNAVRAYQSQCDVVDFDDAVQGLNRYRGELHSWPDGAYAEVFSELK